MKTHTRLLSVTVRADTSAAEARRRLSAMAIRRMAAGAFTALALGSLSLGAVASAAPVASAHGAAGHVKTRVHQAARTAALSVGTVSTGNIMINQLPWMY